jgi:hypothetical protein
VIWLLDHLFHPVAADLPGDGLEAVPGIDRRDRDHERGELGFRVVACGVLPDLVGDL